MSGSHFEQYDEKAYSYKVNRVPTGLAGIRSGLARCALPMKELRLLDAGCGTGNYLQALSDDVRELVGVDASKGMLASAESKNLPNVTVCQSTLQDLPLASASFDGAIINFVLHHLDDDAGCDSGFPAVKKALAEIARVLKPGGLLVIQTSSHEQLLDGYWWAEVIPQGMKAYIRRYPTLNFLDEYLRELGFGDVERTPELNEVLQGDDYFDPEGPLRKEYRDADSNWTVVPDGELEEALATLESYRSENTLGDYVQRRDKLRQAIGQMTLLTTFKNK